MSGRGGGAKPIEMDFSRLVERYGSEDKCRVYLESLRWPEGVVCPRDGKNVAWLQTRRVWDCNSCGYQFTVRVGSVLQDSKLPLWKWLVATFLMVESKKGISANQLRRMAGVSYKTAWFLTHRIREAMGAATGNAPLLGTVEVDSTFIGGKPRKPAFKPNGTRRRGPRPDKPKTTVLGAVARGGEVRLRIDRRSNAMREFVRTNVADGAMNIYTDSWEGYQNLGDENTKHESVNHHAYEWVRGDVHTNTVEGVWSLFKRSIIGSYHHLSVKHMDSYLNEMEWRYNNRHSNYLFRDTLRSLFKAETMTYKNLTERPA